MSDSFKFEIVNPEKIIFSSDVKMVTLPSFEGDMGILKGHVPIITFLRPGIIKAEVEAKKFEEFFVQDGIIEYFNDNLVVLSASVENIKSLSREFLDNLNKNIQDQLLKKDITDNDRYILNHKLDTIKDIRV
tara:strand:+ start:108 stop:503 length:396 start_codon:yes stop_codon:yes gene_type:complete